MKQIPAGKVTNFGTIGKIVGISGQMVGWILSGMSQSEWDISGDIEENKNLKDNSKNINSQDKKIIHWYRVVAKDGSISSLKLGIKGEIQRSILLKQGYKLVDDKVDMSIHYFDFDLDRLL